MITVAIVDNHTIFRQGLIKLLQTAGDISIVGEAGNGDDAYRLIAETKPDIAILDIIMPGMNGFELYEKMKEDALRTKVIFLTLHKDPLTAKKALLSQASGFVIKDNAFEDLLYAIRTVASGNKFVSPAVAEELLQAVPDKENLPTLTPRESEILRLIASGLTNKQIAKNLFISIKTVDTHRTNIMQKLNAHTTADLVRFAFRIGLIER